MMPPMVSFVAWNRLGLTARNLAALLDTEEDFELYIIDSNSMDNTWDFIQELKDERIKSKIKFDKNRGPIYASNYALARRKPEQFFIIMDSDVHIYTKNWITRFMEVFREFPEVGLLGVPKAAPYTGYLPPVLFNIKNGISYIRLKNASLTDPIDFVPGHLQCLKPELINLIGYWSEEGHYGDADISPRIVHYTPFTVGYATTIEIDQVQEITCEECTAHEWCKLDRKTETCFSIRDKFYRNPLFAMKYLWRHLQTFEEIKEGKRTAYCASIHDEESMKNHLYYKDWAEENFNFYE
ncbi:MAG: glycosyltransferase family 2 protein [Ruminiclostridium sp.]|nr:glycosyltransferase family 2 protein [Ruminiclostridium sp.]